MNNTIKKNITRANWDEYTLCSDVSFNRNWVTKKTKRTFITPGFKNKRWTPGKDKMYLACHLINSIDGTGKYFNVAFGEAFQIY